MLRLAPPPLLKVTETVPWPEPSESSVTVLGEIVVVAFPPLSVNEPATVPDVVELPF